MSDQNEILNRVIWYNSHVRVKGLPILCKQAYQEGLEKIAQLVDLDGQFLSSDIICNMCHSCG